MYEEVTDEMKFREKKKLLLAQELGHMAMHVRLI
jgi:hypothetical protein